MKHPTHFCLITLIFLALCIEGNKALGDSTRFPKKSSDQASHSSQDASIATKTEELKKLFQNDGQKTTAVATSENNKEPSKPVTLVQSAEPPTKAPLTKVNVPTRPEIQPLHQEKTTPQSSQADAQPSKTLVPASAVINDRQPLGILDPNQEVKSRKWYLFSVAKRGLKEPSHILEIVNVVGANGSSTRGEEIKTLLIEMGIKPNQLRVINAKAEEKNLAEKVYIFGKKS